jgi:hypothetical protein
MFKNSQADLPGNWVFDKGINQIDEEPGIKGKEIYPLRATFI